MFWSFATFFGSTIFWSGAKQRFCFRESMSVLDQNGRIQAPGFLARWQLTSHALYYNLTYLSILFSRGFSDNVTSISTVYIFFLFFCYSNRVSNWKTWLRRRTNVYHTSIFANEFILYHKLLLLSSVFCAVRSPNLELYVDKGPFKYYVIMFLTFLGPPTVLWV